MGREVRRVPANWQHPKVKRPNYRLGIMEERYQPMHDLPFAPAMREWIEGWEAWERGERTEYTKGETMPYWEYAGAPPDPAYYRPDWPDAERTHLMMYEDTSEGTPISPAFKTPEEVARWCADNGASAFGSETASYEAWLNIARGGWAPGAVYTSETGLISGVEATAAREGATRCVADRSTGGREMTDRELLELAALAAGIEHEGEAGAWLAGQGSPALRLRDTEEVWNPFTDDGDALRLAVTLGLTISRDRYDDSDYMTATPPHTHQSCDCLVDQDPYAATRRAIVRAAAEIGKGESK